MQSLTLGLSTHYIALANMLSSGGNPVPTEGREQRFPSDHEHIKSMPSRFREFKGRGENCEAPTQERLGASKPDDQ